MSRIHRSARRIRSRTHGVVGLVVGMAVGMAVLQAPAGAAAAPVTVKTVSSQVVPAGAMTTVVPRYSVGKRVRVLSARVDVKRGSTWIARGVRRVKVPAGTYRVTTKVSYRQRVGGKLTAKRVESRSYTLRLTPAPVSSPAPVSAPVVAPVTTYVPAPAPVVTAPASLTRTSSSCYDVALVKADGTPWRCTFFDDFSGTTLDRTKWVPQETATSHYQIGADCYVDRPENISVAGGNLALTVRKESAPVECPGARKGDETVDFTAGSVSTWGLFTQARGRFEFRAAFPAMKKSLSAGVAGPHSALWLFPADPAGLSAGEIDVVERYPQWADYGVPYIHYLPDEKDRSVTSACFIADPSQFHTYTLEWTPTTISIAYDGVTCVSHAIKALDPVYGPAPFDRAFMLVLTQGLSEGATTDTTPNTATTRIDYVRVWK